jgi:hypothetical protein
VTQAALVRGFGRSLSRRHRRIGRMKKALFVAAVCAASTAVSFAQAPAASAAAASTVVESALEIRFQIDLHVTDAAVKAMLPEGFTSSVAVQGPAKDCNVRLIFVDRVTVNGPDGKPVGNGSSHFAYLVAPAKDRAGANAQVVLGGITDDTLGTPGPFDNFLAAKVATVKRTTSSTGDGPATDSQDWVLEAATGEHLELHVEYERGVGNRPVAASPEVKYYSAKDASLVQVVKQEQVLDILKNVTTNPKDRVHKYTLKCGGGSYAKLCDGSEKSLSWDNILWNNRTISKP